MLASSKVHVYEELQRLGRDAADELEKNEGKRNALKAYKLREKVTLLNSISVLCPLVKRCSRHEWEEVERLIDEAIEIPYPQFRPLFKLGIINVIRTFPNQRTRG